MATTRHSCPAPKVSAGSVIWSWITTVDHKRIGILYGVSAFFFFLVGGVEALIMRLQLAHPDGTLVTAGRFNELFTMHGRPWCSSPSCRMSAAFFNFMIPLMIGARDVALPAAERAVLLDLLLGRPPPASELPRGRGAGRRVVRLRESDLAPVLAHPQHRLLDARPAGAGHLVADGGLQLHRDHHQHARARHDPHAHAAVRRG